jgi:scyllo-inositol 2-dehydrogenase (NADP+)
MNRPISTALLSYGMSGEVFHAPLLAALPQFQLTAIVQRNSERSKIKYPGARVAGSVTEILQDESIELVVVNTPNNLHYAHASEALHAGKHVVVEKPFTIKYSEACDLMALAEKKGRCLTVFQNRRWDGDFLTVQQILRENLVGPVVEFEAHYDRFRNYIESNTWKEEGGDGKGIVYNLGSHMLDQALVLFGMPLYLDARIGARRNGSLVDDFYDIRMEYERHNVIVKSSYLVKESMPRYILHGVTGSYVKYGIDPQEQSLKEGKDPNAGDWGREPESDWGMLNTTIEGIDVRDRVETVPGDYKQFYVMLHDAIRHGRNVPVFPAEAAKVIRLIEACYESNAAKAAVRVAE